MSHVKVTENQGFAHAADNYVNRHIGPSDDAIGRMLGFWGVEKMDQLMDEAVPAVIRMSGELNLPEPCSESNVLEELGKLADKNQLYRSFLPPHFKADVLKNDWIGLTHFFHYVHHQIDIS